jgi:hypothetical protein
VNPEPTASVTHIRVERADDRLAQLSHDERMRLIVRVLCELVAYDQPQVDTADPTSVDLATRAPVTDAERVAS